ncbi:hypothetical protein HK096_004264, partial [Nowakowskiella sp. JEL0078]
TECHLIGDSVSLLNSNSGPGLECNVFQCIPFSVVLIPGTMYALIQNILSASLPEVSGWVITLMGASMSKTCI